MQISIESTELTQRTSQAGKPYSTQQAYAHLMNSDGSPQRYPREIIIFPNRDAQGNSIAYQKGDYEMQDSSFKVERDRLEIAFINLKKITK